MNDGLIAPRHHKIERNSQINTPKNEMTHYEKFPAFYAVALYPLHMQWYHCMYFILILFYKHSGKSLLTLLPMYTHIRTSTALLRLYSTFQFYYDDRFCSDHCCHAASYDSLAPMLIKSQHSQLLPSYSRQFRCFPVQ